MSLASCEAELECSAMHWIGWGGFERQMNGVGATWGRAGGRCYNEQFEIGILLSQRTETDFYEVKTLFPWPPITCLKFLFKR